jgi:hypothetical protein
MNIIYLQIISFISYSEKEILECKELSSENTKYDPEILR